MLPDFPHMNNFNPKKKQDLNSIDRRTSLYRGGYKNVVSINFLKLSFVLLIFRNSKTSPLFYCYIILIVEPFGKQNYKEKKREKIVIDKCFN